MDPTQPDRKMKSFHLQFSSPNSLFLQNRFGSIDPPERRRKEGEGEIGALSSDGDCASPSPSCTEKEVVFNTLGDAGWLQSGREEKEGRLNPGGLNSVTSFLPSSYFPSVKSRHCVISQMTDCTEKRKEGERGKGALNCLCPPTSSLPFLPTSELTRHFTKKKFFQEVSGKF